jgi:hypothetical protein
MHRPLTQRIVAVVAAASALPASAHVTTGAIPHWHAADIWGVLAVCALTAVAAWIDRRR